MAAGNHHLSDEALTALAQGGNDSALSQLILRMMPMVRRKAGQYHLPGMEAEDLVQEGLLGLLKAVRLFRPDVGSSFSYYASLCISTQMASAAKAALSQKSRPLRDYAPLDDPDAYYPAAELTPEDHAILTEQMEDLQKNIATRLSEMEQRILWLYLSGLTYQQIALLQHTTAKAVDNALQRVRRKLRPV